MENQSVDDTARYFTEGAEIEISSNDEGFQGSWYAGIIIRPPPDTNIISSKVLVEYKKLMEDDSNSNPLREELDLVNIRPALPVENRSIYKRDEEVDAYYNDGWWEGFITDVLGDDLYSVFFRGTREQISFRSSQLRLHREWIYGKWVPPFEELPETTIVDEELEASSRRSNRKKTTTEDQFQQGVLIETCSDEDGFQGAWFTAKVVKKGKNDKYLIEYLTLRCDDDSDYLREEIDRQYMRPSPPDIIAVSGFDIKDEVDAYYNEGWWSGVISKIGRNNTYVVYFENTGEKLKFRDQDLRVRQEWKHGKWIVCSKVREAEEESK